METQSRREGDEVYNKEVNDLIHKNIFDSLGRIETQTIKSNGSVGELNRWRERVTGAFWAAGIFMTVIVIPILSWAVWTLVHLPSTINDGIKETLSIYDIEIK